MKVKLLTAVVLALAVVVLAPASAQAQVDWGARIGLALDGSDPLFAVEAIMPISGEFFFNPNIEHVFGDEDYTSINADVHYDFDIDRRDHFFWAGVGAAAILDDDTDFGANVFAGYGIDMGSLIPYLQAKLLFADDTEGSISLGVRF